MGRVKIKGCENIFWDPVKLLDYLNREKVNQPIKYDYEKQQQDDVNVAIGVFNKQQRKVN